MDSKKYTQKNQRNETEIGKKFDLRPKTTRSVEDLVVERWCRLQRESAEERHGRFSVSEKKRGENQTKLSL
ncbi:hypothetical protein HYC85_004693 [Camellia sinensis]|uniref:Uncharacterized protein n=1 Tax=Camellia sinensis TaxID=4442 RepID=A0A7J7HZY4_CAMSI|nr:hypothetical protein HYC85_004693 [Camellia sinensis]